MNEHRPLRVLVIDDSALSRQTISRMLESSPLIEVVGRAADGDEALRRTLELEPDLVTLDLEMPRMDGFTFLRLVMARCPTPVLVVSGRDGEKDVFKALELGAIDFVAKPKGTSEAEREATQRSLIEKVFSVRELRIDKVRERLDFAPPARRPDLVAASHSKPVLVVGASTGGPTALLHLLSAFPEPLPCACLVAQHMPTGFTAGFAERLDRATVFDVVEAKGGETLDPGRVLIAPGGRDLELVRNQDRVETRVSPAGKEARNVPSADRLFASAAKEMADGVISLVLTGMGDDGREGARQVKAAGGRVITESEETAVIYGMPRQVVAAGWSDAELALGEIPDALEKMMNRTKTLPDRRGRDRK